MEISKRQRSCDKDICNHFHRSLFCICKQWFVWEQSSLQNKFFPAMCFAACNSALMGWWFLEYSSDIRLLIFRKSTSLSFGFFGAKRGVASLLKSEVLMMLYSCKKAKSTVMCSFKLIGVGGFWLQAELTSMVVNFTSKSLLMPMSDLCLTKCQGNWTRISSMAWCACLANVELVRSKSDKNRPSDSWLSCRSSWSNFCKTIHSRRLCFCIVLCWVSSRSSSGVGNR